MATPIKDKAKSIESENEEVTQTKTLSRSAFVLPFLAFGLGLIALPLSLFWEESVIEINCNTKSLDKTN